MPTPPQPIQPSSRVRHSRVFFLMLSAAVAVATPVIADPADNAGSFTSSKVENQSSPAKLPVFDLAGKPVDPFGHGQSNIVVLIFMSVDCPISNRYAPVVQRLCKRFASRPVCFWLVQPEENVPVERTRRHLREFGYTCGLLRDPQHVLVKKSKATITPESAVFNPAGDLLYHGRLDNRYADFGKMRPQATEHDLQDAIEAALKGKAPARSSAPAIGCTIPDLP
jgi:hypothetical protein